MKVVSTGFTGVRSTFGKITRTLGPGLNFYLPFVQKIHLVSNKVRVSTFTIHDAKTADNVYATIQVDIQSRIDEENSALSLYSTENAFAQFGVTTGATIRKKVADVTLLDLYPSRDDISVALKADLVSAMCPYGHTIIAAAITHIEPDPKVKEALNNVEAEKRVKEATAYKAEADYIIAIKKAEAEKQKKILYGEGINAQRSIIFEGFLKLGVTPLECVEYMTKFQQLDAFEILVPKFRRNFEALAKSPNAKTIFAPNDNKLLQALEASKE